MRLLILSDIHGNMAALEAVLKEIEEHICVDACVLLGDIIDYGMHSNEVVQAIKKLKYQVICNIRGNHEQAVISDDYDRFSSERGKLCAQYTKSVLSDETWDYILNDMSDTGIMEFVIDNKKCLAIHGSLEDIYWKSIKPEQVISDYSEYDYVFSGHSHLPHFFEVFYKKDDPKHRNRKKTIFINPGSVGQPRNLNPMAQFAIFDTETEDFCMKKIEYDVKREQMSYNGQVDNFYKERLESGI